MKNRRIYLQPGESVEIMNQYGTSTLKAVTKFDRITPCVVIYEQPDVTLYTAEESKDKTLSNFPTQSASLQVQEKLELGTVNPLTIGDQ